MGGRGSASGRAGGGSPIKYKSSDNALYESPNEVLYVERIDYFGSNTDVLNATSDGNGNITLDYARADDFYQQNKRTKYGLYELKTGITNANDIHASRLDNATYGRGTGKSSNVKSENSYGDVRSVGIDWDKVKSVSGKTFNIKDMLKHKGFKWNSSEKNWKK